jgi:hypothetical protein
MFIPNAMQAEILAEDPLRYLISAGTGGGKTALALLLAEGRILVVSPKTNRIDQNFKRDAALIGMEPPLHISKEDFVKNEPGPCDTLILDECEWAFGVEPNTYRKGGFEHIKTSGIHDAVFQYIQKHQPKRIYLLSATPCEKRMQAWAAARLLGVLKKPDFESFVAFREFTHKPRSRGYSTLWLEKKTKKSQDAVRVFLRSFGYFKEMDKAEPNIINIPIELTDAQLEKIRATGEKYPEKKTTDDRDAIDENSAVRNMIKYGIECGVFTEYIFDDEKHTQKRISTEISTNYLFELHKIVVKEQNPIIFAQYIKQIDIIKRYLEEHTNLNIVVITGSIKEADRAKALHDIASVPNTVLIAQASISAGWQTLISSATIFASVTRWRHYQQGIGRNSRYQNRHEVKNVYRLYLGPVSHHIWEDIIDQRKDFNDSLQSI